ncbi:MAG TPA: hypothetical protein VII12_20430, partial [Thermoanaerobaculia bacterium]
MKRRVIAGAVAALLLLIGIFAVLLSRQRLRRHRYFPAAPVEKRIPAPAAVPSAVLQWTDQFRTLEVTGRWNDLAKLLENIEKSN